MARVLISFPNQRRGIVSPLAVLDTETRHCEIIDLKIDEPYAGTTGLCRLGNGALAVALMGPHHGFAVIHPENFRVLYAIHYPGIKEPHSLLASGNSHAYVCSSGNDTVFLVGLGSAISIEKVWEHPVKNETVPNFHHVNSIARNDHGDLCITQFGEKVKSETEASWWLNVDGQIVNIDTNNTIASGLFHPHSLIPYPRGFLVCESSAGKVHQLRFNGELLATIELAGYTRGLGWDYQNIYVGLSVRRQVSRSTGIVNPHPQLSSRVAVVAILSHALELQKIIELPDCGEEIYDIMVL